MHVNYIRNFLREVRDQLNNECIRLQISNDMLYGTRPEAPPNAPASGTIVGNTIVEREPSCFAEEYQLLVTQITDNMVRLGHETERATSLTNEKDMPKDALAR